MKKNYLSPEYEIIPNGEDILTSSNEAMNAIDGTWDEE